MVKYEFRTYATDDCRPLKEVDRWWVSGYGQGYYVVVCYLDKNENLFDYWDDAFGIFVKE